MSVSDFSAAQREQQQQKLKKFLVLSFLASAVLHGVVLPLSLNFVKPAESAEEPIEFIVVEEPETAKVEPEPAVEKEVLPPPETSQPETPPPIPQEEPIAQTPPIPQEEPIAEPIPQEEPIAEPIPQQEPIAQTPPIPQEEAIAETPPIPQQEPIAQTPPIPQEEAIAETPPIPLEPPAIASERSFEPSEAPEPPISDSPPFPPANTESDRLEPENSSAPPQEPPPLDEPPVTASRPSGAAESTDFMADAGNPIASSSPGESESKPPSDESEYSEEPASEPFENNWGAPSRPPASEEPVTAFRPGGGTTSSGSFTQVGSPDAAEIPAESDAFSSADGGGEGEVPFSETFGSSSGGMERAPSNTDSPVTASRPGSGGGSGDFFGEAGNSDVSGIPGGERGGENEWNSSSGGSGYGEGIASSEPFSSSVGAMPKPESSAGGSGNSSRRSGASPGTCIRCNQPAYPTQARKDKREGEVEVSVDIDADGNVLTAVVVKTSGHEDLDRAAMNGVRNWKFSSGEGEIKGKLIVIEFNLN